ncbi:MAG: secondary thiamine-phosphate synthase enzyme YjbQ [Candidatus Diapherotrites archaeon]|uniref:Secondary thiamine-phosphate synthase enzyme YjbQ n=1 Tax=Candidatus Iainarchaeum sp. TaxID=3101447 RepID=A0A8T4L890_9ARCH|nr:secondary thiamine-phosphate synthase enzyme YjbQ [Candidatus Diapherotrites archaeon]
MFFELEQKTTDRNQLVDISDLVQETVSKSKVESGFVVVFVPHSTAGVTINENADPDVSFDLLSALSKLVPKDSKFRHAEGNSDAHLKSSLIGSSVMVLIEQNRLVLGTWQGIFFAEFDGPRTRQVLVSVFSKK